VGFGVVAGWCLGGELDGPRVVAVWWFWGIFLVIGLVTSQVRLP
jgi:hypothetical protein